MTNMQQHHAIFVNQCPQVSSEYNDTRKLTRRINSPFHQEMLHKQKTYQSWMISIQLTHEGEMMPK